MAWEVEVTDQFVEWYNSLNGASIDAMERAVALLEAAGPALGRPHADKVRLSRYPNMKELRVQTGGSPLRVFFAFDPRRVAILLIGGDKTGDDRFYDRMIRLADELYDEHLADLAEESGSG